MIARTGFAHRDTTAMLTLRPTFPTTAAAVRPRLARALPVLLAVAGLAALVLAVHPSAMAAALRRFDLRALLPLALLGAAFYVLQGLRWHLLLRQVGAAARVSDSLLVNLAGQAVSAVLPLGDVTRALMMSRTTGAALGATAATVTVQELSFMLLVVAAAAPGLARLPGGPVLMLLVVAGIAGVFAVLTVPRLYAAVRRAVLGLPGAHRFAADVDALQREVSGLLRRPAVLAGAVLDAGRVVVAVAALLVILRALHIGGVGWWDGALVLAISFVGGALSLLPGGVGANEAGVAGILIAFGVHPVAAAAVAIMQRLWLVSMPLAGGGLAWVWLPRRRARTATLHRAWPASPSPVPAALTGRPSWPMTPVPARMACTRTATPCIGSASSTTATLCSST